MIGQSILEEEIKVAAARKLRIAVWMVSIIVLVLVALMRSPYKFVTPLEVEEKIKMLPAVSALINTLVAACLMAGLWSILRKKILLHQGFMTAALVLSAVFLLCYVTYHFTTVETKFGDVDGNRVVDEAEAAAVGWQRSFYLVLLITHITAAAVSFPMILMSFVHAWTRDFGKHRKLVRITYPLWLYVAVTGPICYWMLKPYYL